MFFLVTYLPSVFAKGHMLLALEVYVVKYACNIQKATHLTVIFSVLVYMCNPPKATGWSL